MIYLKPITLSVTALLLILSGNPQIQAQPVPTVVPRSDPSLYPVIFNAPPPPRTGRPGRRSDAGSRGCGAEESSSPAETQALSALVPIQETANSTASTTVVFGKTAAEHPTFWFYVPHGSGFTAMFVLQDQQGNAVYQSDVVLPPTAGILSLTLPAATPPLELGTPYHWFLKLYCRSTSPPNSFVDGWIQREPLPSELAQQLAVATLPQQTRLYAAQGFWHEALTTAAALRQGNSEDTAWTMLLQAIGLEQLATEAILTPQN